MTTLKTYFLDWLIGVRSMTGRVLEPGEGCYTSGLFCWAAIFGFVMSLALLWNCWSLLVSWLLFPALGMLREGYGSHRAEELRSIGKADP